MDIQDAEHVYDTVEFADNPEARCSIVLILDVSDSMGFNGGVRINTVNNALAKFRDAIQEDALTSLRADVAVIAFNNEAWLAQDFTNGTAFEPPVLTAYGGTNFSKAINLALDTIAARKQSYRDGGIAYYRSLAYFLTDGIPEHDSNADLEQAAVRLAKAEEAKQVAFFSFLVRDSARRTDMSQLTGLAPPQRPPVELTNMEQLTSSIVWLSRSAAAVSHSQPGEGVRLPSPEYLEI